MCIQLLCTKGKQVREYIHIKNIFRDSGHSNNITKEVPRLSEMLMCDKVHKIDTSGFAHKGYLKCASYLSVSPSS